jgi:TRAP-type C4-dicarboxylate transport system substrate-binding protein
VALAAALAIGGALAQTTTKIKIADSFPVGHYLPRYITTPMMERLKANPAAKGIEFEYYPAEQMGKAKDFLSLVQSGVIDIAYVAPGFVSDKMPLSVVAELLFTIVLPPYQIVTRKPFSNLKDIEGMKIRASGSAKELVIKKLKATPVLMPTPDVYESLSRGTIDGVLFPFNSLPPYEIHKLSKTGTIGENFGTFVANWVISEKRFQSLPPAVQQDLTAMGEQLTKSACAQVEKDEAGDIEKVKAAGVKLTPLSAADKATVATVMQDVAKDWAETLDKRGKSGTEVLNAFKAGLK